MGRYSLCGSITHEIHLTVMQKNCVFIAAILSELRAPWQPVLQGYVIGLTTLNPIMRKAAALILFKLAEEPVAVDTMKQTKQANSWQNESA